jgi:N12 class adenine-specific DNA methylase
MDGASPVCQGMDSFPQGSDSLPRSAIPAEALAVCADVYGEVLLPAIAMMLGQGEEQARRSLGTLVFDDPATGRLVPAGAYLSGRVRRKLAAAAEAARHDPRFEVNVRELRKVIPPDLGPSEITAQLGAPWIGKDDVAQFVRDLLGPGGSPTVRVEHPGGTVWDVSGPETGVLSTAVWGTARYPAPRLVQALLEHRVIEVRDTVPGPGGKHRVLNIGETSAALGKARAIAERFAGWAWEDPGRAARLARVYNEMFNDLVPRSYEGARLSLPGLSPDFRPSARQAEAVARILGEPATGVFQPYERARPDRGDAGVDGTHAVLIMAAMEMRRLGQARKPLIAVPRAGASRFAADFRNLYPQAKLLVAAAHPGTAQERESFLGQAAEGDWDAVIIPDSLQPRIPVPEGFRQAYLNRERAAVDDLAMAARSGGETAALSRLESRATVMRERAARDATAPGHGYTIRDAGFDALLVMDPQGLKNLATTSGIPEARVAGSARAADLHMKTEWARENGYKVVFAAAEPPANGDVHTLLRYLQPGLLRDAGVLDRDAWLAAHAVLRPEISLFAGQAGARVRTIVRGWVNVPEMMRLLQMTADIRTPAPPQPETVGIEPTPGMRKYFADLADRAARIREGTGGDGAAADTMLKVISSYGKAVIDMRLAGQPMDGSGKLHAAADSAAALYREHQARDSSGDTALGQGLVQLVYCDQAGPRDGWNARDELRRQLTAHGIPPHMIRFAAEADGDGEKTALLAEDCRAGRVAVLIASGRSLAATAPAVQDTLAAVHYVDAPQQEDWVRHQARRDPSVQVVRYLTAQSPDGLRWDAIDRKDQIIQQIMHGPDGMRTVHVPGDDLTFTELKDLAAGTPARGGTARRPRRSRRPPGSPATAPGRR